MVSVPLSTDIFQSHHVVEFFFSYWLSHSEFVDHELELLNSENMFRRV